MVASSQDIQAVVSQFMQYDPGFSSDRMLTNSRIRQEFSCSTLHIPGSINSRYDSCLASGISAAAKSINESFRNSSFPWERFVGQIWAGNCNPTIIPIRQCTDVQLRDSCGNGLLRCNSHRSNNHAPEHWQKHGLRSSRFSCAQIFRRSSTPTKQPRQRRSRCSVQGKCWPQAA